MLKSAAKAKSSAPGLSGEHAELEEIHSTRRWSILFGVAVVVGSLCIIALASGVGESWATAVDMKKSQALPVLHERDVEVVSWKNPRIFVWGDFLSSAECDYIIQKGLNLGIERSRVVGEKSDVVNDVRTSKGRFMSAQNDPILARIEERIALWTHVPVENQEQYYLLQYNVGEKYLAHHDYFEGAGSERYIGSAGQRIMTVLMYLSDEVTGGETFFPAMDDVVALSPKKGTAVLFYSAQPDGQLDPASLHGSAPVKEGVKYALTKWIRSGSYERR